MATETPPASGPATAQRPPDADAPTQVHEQTPAPGEALPSAAGEPPPKLAEGIELVGEYRDSGFKEPPFIVRRADGQVIQLPALLYRLAEQVDGRRSYEEIGEALSHAVGRGVTGDMVKMLADEQLRPLGVLAAADGSSPPLQKADPLLALRFRAAVVPERFTRALTTVFKPLFLPPLVIAVVAGLLALDAWLFFGHGIAASLRTVIYNPALLLGLLGCVALATAFHEIGHATACRYGGAKPGVMGVGIYVVWPAFYTDVTDAYRLSRGGRLRTDLGGVYFNAVFALVSAGLYFATGFEPLLLLVLLQNFAILQQLLPLLRLDGYYIISDLTGVPDMLSRIKPVLTSLLPGREPSDRVTELKPWVRVVVTGYVCTVVPLLLAAVVLMVLHAPRAFATAYDSFGVQWDRIASASGIVAGAAGTVQMVMLLLPCAGMALTSGRVGGRVCGSAWRWSDGEPLRRGVLGVGTVGIAALAAFIWWPNGDYRPIQPTERGTVQGAVGSISAVPTGRPALTVERERQLGGAPTERERRRAQQPAAEREAPTEERQTTTPSDQSTSTATTETTTTPTTETVAPGSTTTTPAATTPTVPTDTTTTPVPPAATTTTPGAVPPETTTTAPAPAVPAPAP
ncbi:MAG: putative peptide zinc metalloprotease protein [Solirubrobacteraceae bacterium]|nr:putative peptide zinc metalloprotease protein [Solirubrobacteraceae bacterium]